MSRDDWALLAIGPYTHDAVRRHLYGGRTEAELLALADRRVAPTGAYAHQRPGVLMDEDVVVYEQVRRAVHHADH